MRRSAYLFVFMCCFVYGVANATDQSSDSIEILKHYKDKKTFAATFKQIFTSRLSKDKRAEAGKVYYQAPSKIRFDFILQDKTERQFFISDKKVVSLNHIHKTANSLKTESDIAQYLVFLKGVDEITRKFHVKRSDSQKAVSAGIEMKKDDLIFKLTPKEIIKNVKYIFLVVREKEVYSVVLIDNLNNMTQFVFDQIEYNKEIKNTIFNITIPKGYDVSEF